METYEAALEYKAAGWSCIPILQSSKKPAIKWTQFQERLATDEEIKDWFAVCKFNIAICCGKLSNVCVVDVDPRHGGIKSMPGVGLAPENATVLTGNSGYHYYFKYPVLPVFNFAGRWPGVDFRGEGGYVLAPPSRHPDTGRYYEFQHSRPTNLEELPALFMDNSKVGVGKLSNEGFSKAGKVSMPRSKGTPNVSQGGRNQAAASLVGTYLAKGLSQSRILSLLKLWNSDNTPPLTDSELKTVLYSMSKTHQRNLLRGR